MAGVKGRSGRLPYNEQRDFSLLVNKCYKYLLHNFSKLDKNQKIHISLELVKRSMPTNVKVNGEITHHLAQKVQDGRLRASEVTPSEN